VIWATGYRFDFDWIDLPVLNAEGAPVHRGGLTSIPGLYFLGLPWLSKMNSSFLSGVGEDAARLATYCRSRGKNAQARHAREDIHFDRRGASLPGRRALVGAPPVEVTLDA
jgi:hypothetical protein